MQDRSGLRGRSPRRAVAPWEWWRRRESNPPESPAVAGLQGDGTKGGTKDGTAAEAPPVAEPVAASPDDGGVATMTLTALVARLGSLLRRLIDAGSPRLPLRVRLDLAMLLARSAVD